jgi:hypothetical protein
MRGIAARGKRYVFTARMHGQLGECRQLLPHSDNTGRRERRE